MFATKAFYLRVFIFLVISSAVLGCGGYNNPTTSSATTCTTTVSVFPQNVTLTHGSGSDSQQFGAAAIVPSGCTAPTVPSFGITWSTSDPVDVPVSNNHDNTNGTATCLHSTPEPVTVIATLPGSTSSGNVTGTASVFCN